MRAPRRRVDSRTMTAAAPDARDRRRGDLGGSRSAAPAVSLRGAVSTHDATMIGYFAIVRAVLAFLPESPARTFCARASEGCLVALVAGLLVARVIPGIPALVRAVAYRLVLVGALGASYALLVDLLPIVRSDAYDEELIAIDRALFGCIPAVWLERLNRPAVVEYFAFFYFGYYFVCGGYALVGTFIARGERQLTEFAVGTFLMYAVAHTVYMLVPAYGPATYLPSSFAGPVDGGFFWGIVKGAVESSSPVKEIFPSMHTGGSVWFTLHAIRRARTEPRWRIPAAVTAFAAAHIVFATVFLRWHYAIDIVAGLALAGIVAWVTPRIVAREARFREARGLPAVWPQGTWFSR